MIHHPFIIVIVLLAIEVTILYFSNHSRFQKYFQFLPSVFWIYFLPMLASSIGILDPKSSVYSFITTNFLPCSLLLLLISVDIKAIMRLGKTALIMFFAGSAGIILGTPLVFFIFKGILGSQFWSGFGALSASWTGGSANMIAVKEALGVPDSVFLPMVIVDTIVPYLWMGTLVAFAGFQILYDRWNKSNRKVLDELGQKIAKMPTQKRNSLKIIPTCIILIFAVLGSLLSQAIAYRLPIIKDVISGYAWMILTVSVLGILLSFTPARKLENFGASKVGYFLLYFVLTSIGAKASISHIGSAIILILAGIMIVFFHAVVLIFVGRMIKAPMFLIAVASQANIGGVASTPIVAEIYQKGFASVGLLLAILGNIIGTYFGILAGQLCRWVAHL